MTSKSGRSVTGRSVLLRSEKRNYILKEFFMPQEPANPLEQKIESQHPILETTEHVLGAGLGAAGGMAIGAVVGAVGGPPGIVVGAIAGAVAGGVGGEALAELIDAGFDDHYWQEHSDSHGYLPAEQEQYRSAYHLGWLARRRFGDQSFDEVEAQLRQEWDSQQAAARLPWDQVMGAAREAWNAAPPLKLPPDASPPPH
jgi:hypothetical protein